MKGVHVASCIPGTLKYFSKTPAAPQFCRNKNAAAEKRPNNKTKAIRNK